MSWELKMVRKGREGETHAQAHSRLMNEMLEDARRRKHAEQPPPNGRLDRIEQAVGGLLKLEPSRLPQIEDQSTEHDEKTAGAVGS